jgi:hypothetical protein
MKEKILSALSKLDVNNDDHWTTEGLPRLDVLKEIIGEPVTRADITVSKKGFSRKTPDLQLENTEDGVKNAQATTVETTNDEDESSDKMEESKEVQLEFNIGSEEAIEAELKSANEALYKAQARHRKAVEDMDVVIAKRNEREAGRTTAHDIKAYQKSQLKQREAASNRQKFMVEAVSAIKEKF